MPIAHLHGAPRVAAAPSLSGLYVNPADWLGTMQQVSLQKTDS